MDKRGKESKLIFIIAVLVLVGVIFVGLKFIKKPAGMLEAIISKKEIAVKKIFENKVLVQNEDGVIDKIDVATGKGEEKSALEQDDFTNFAGLTEVLADKSKSIQQLGVIISQDKSKAIVTVITYDSGSGKSDEVAPVILETKDYLCEIEKKSCQKTDLLIQSYEGLDGGLQKNADSFVWTAWNEATGMLLGNVISQEAGNVAPIYVCDTEKKICAKTGDAGLGVQKRAIVPNGAFSPTLEKFAMIVQNDQPNLETGKTWELLLFAVGDLTKPIKSYDLSTIIDRDENVAYDSVYSLAWNGTEDKLAIGTARKIFMLDLQSESLSLTYIAPTDEEGDFYWDSSRLFLSPDANSIVFVDESDEIASEVPATGEGSEPGDMDVTYVNVLKKIDLKNNNVVSELFKGAGLSLK